MPPGSKVLGDWTVRGEKLLRMAGGFEPLHAIFSLACGAMRVLATIIEGATLAMLHPGQDLTLRRAIALQLLGDDHPWHVLQTLEQRAKKLLRRVRIAPALHQNVEDIIVLVHRTPERMALPVDRQKHFIQVPLVPWLRASMLQLIGVLLPKTSASITASATFGHSASPCNVTCWYIMALPCALKIYVKYSDNFLPPELIAFQSLTNVFLFQ